MVVPGMHDEANDSWVEAAKNVAPTRERWVIQQEGVKPGEQFLARSIDPRHVITIGTDEEPSITRKKIDRVIKSSNATVIVDMQLGLDPRESAWDTPVNWAIKIVNVLADAYVDSHPKARTVFIAHSAGTEVMAAEGTLMPPPGKIDNKRPLFNDVYLMSPRRLDKAYPKNAVMIFADGDFYANRGSATFVGTVVQTYTEKDAIKLQELGYNVVRIEGAAGHHAMALAAPFFIPAVAYEGFRSWRAHTRSTETAYQPKLKFYAAHASGGVSLPNTALGQAITAVSAWPVGDPARTTQIRQWLQDQQPTPGLGGISLNATAWIPIDPGQINFAGYLPDESRLYLKLRSGRIIRFPTFDPEVLRLSYDIAYVRGEKAELSISGPRAISPGGRQVMNRPPTGHFAVYYFGHTSGTLLGLAMYEADSALARLAFGSTERVQSVAKAVPGFRSLAELFPEKYTDNPAVKWYAGEDTRIFITPAVIELLVEGGGNTLRFGQTSFAARFGQTGAAEIAYATFFQAYFDEIVKTEEGAALRPLVPYARAMAIFKWFKENGVRFDAGGLDSVVLSNVFTPSSTPIPKAPTLGDVASRRPTIFFGPSGPTRLVRADGRETIITYKNALIASVSRYDGAVMTVYRDNLGRPLAAQLGARNAVAFDERGILGLALAKGVNLSTTSGDIQVRLRNNTEVYPISNPENIVASMAARFAAGENE